MSRHVPLAIGITIGAILYGQKSWIPEKSYHVLSVFLIATLLAGIATYWMIPKVGPAFASAGRKGQDLLKVGRPVL
jgi:hypothetical protein